MTLKPFALSRCEKCQSTDLAVHWCPSGALPYYLDRYCDDWATPHERLEVRCRRCGFAWGEMVAPVLTDERLTALRAEWKKCYGGVPDPEDQG